MSVKTVTITLILGVSAQLSSCDNGSVNTYGLFNASSSGWNIETGTMLKVAAQVKSAADRLYSQSLSPFKQRDGYDESNEKSCKWENTALLTIYSTNNRAQAEIDVKIDGYPVGSLSTYFPDGGPACRNPGTKGVITLSIPAGDHVLEARSLNVSWPGHEFSVEKCECRLLSLS